MRTIPRDHRKIARAIAARGCAGVALVRESEQKPEEQIPLLEGAARQFALALADVREILLEPEGLETELLPN